MTPLLALRQVRRDFPCGEGVYAALRDVTLDIFPGEFVAIVGASGSGKSTLMNILGCLDRPTQGTYRIAGSDTAAHSPYKLAQLRSERFGFIFQRYNLLADLTTIGNVELPAIYAGRERMQRQSRAAAILTRLKLGDRLNYRPAQLSGGQQQRVSIARALMNGGEVIFADEPTGALDSQVGEEVLTILKELHSRGHTILVVTHDAGVALHAERIIEMRDGGLVSDSRSRSRSSITSVTARNSPVRNFQRCEPACVQIRRKGMAFVDRSLDALRIALLAMGARRLRTFLTMLGIIIGIASLVSVVALGVGAQEEIVQNIGALGTDTLDIYPGTGSGDMGGSRIQTLRPADAVQLAAQPLFDSVTPNVSTATTVRYASRTESAQVYGVGGEYFRVKGMKVIEGSTFDEQSVTRMDQSVVIDEYARQQLFGATKESPIGKIILLGKVAARVIGVLQRSGGASSGTSLSVWVPYTTVMARMLGRSYISSITLRVAAKAPMNVAEAAVTELLSRQHGRKDFFIQDTAQIRESVQSATRTMRLLIGSIAAISLLVGGIGVMNIMLVSVTERTREIGVRMSVGARQSDILRQFLIEAVLICLIGGALGILLALGVGVLAAHSGQGNLPLIFSTESLLAAFVFSSLIGVVFGFLPARNAARLNPADALARE